ncbi:hypothetical protein FOZ60_010645 [Perkinsus olseni]|uniref:Uncharacterized protein n=3 Tax=Perkinsus olseni TaxID=32597 RepID=A0A7J6NEQ1_PEROL|nr:hypothetical protein FOZ60_010645 [Perkinsus olseni]
MVRTLGQLVVLGLHRSHVVAPDSTLVAAGTYGSFAPVGDFAGIVMELYTNMTTTLHFLQPGVATAIPVGPHELEPDGAGCFMYSRGNLLGRRILKWSFEDLESRLPNGSSPQLNWWDMRVCPASGTAVNLIFGGQPYELFKVVEGPDVDNLSDTANSGHRRGARGGVTSSGTITKRPHDDQESRVFERSAMEQTASSRIIGQQYHPVLAPQGGFSAADPPPLWSYDNAEPIPGFRKVIFVVQPGLLCTFVFHLPGDPLPWAITPYKMVFDVEPRCLKYDSSDVSEYRGVAQHFSRLAKSLKGEHVSAAGIRICFENPQQAELTIGRGTYKMIPSFEPDAKQNPTDSTHAGTAALAHSQTIHQSQKRTVRQPPEGSGQRPVLQTPTESETRDLATTVLIPSTVYESVSPVLGFVKVTMRIVAESSRTFCFFPPGKERPLVVGPLAMVVNILTGCYMFDTINPSHRGAVTADFRRFSKVLGG